jgi:hypothetical protein
LFRREYSEPNEVGVDENQPKQRRILPKIAIPGKAPNAGQLDLGAEEVAQPYLSPMRYRQPETSTTKLNAGIVRGTPENENSQLAQTLVPPLSPVKPAKDFKGDDMAYWLYRDNRKKLRVRRLRKIRAIEMTEEANRKRQKEEENASGLHQVGIESSMDSHGMPGDISHSTPSDEETENDDNRERKNKLLSPLGLVMMRGMFDDEKAFREY